MLAESIKREASRLKAKYQTVDLHKICQRLKIRVQELPMGTSPKACKGFFLVNARCKVITINSDLPEEIRRIILAHELGHAILHCGPALAAFHDFSPFDFNNQMEYEANIFAAEFLLDNEDVLDALHDQIDLYSMAKLFCVPPELMDFKNRILQREGYDSRASYIAHGGWLKRDLERPICE